MRPREAGWRSSRRKVRGSLLGLLLVLPACSPFAAAEAERADGGVGSDASSDADGSTPASPDGGLDAAALDASFSGCADPGAHTICENFDRPNPFSAWQQVEPSDVTVVSVDTQFAVSAPNSLRVDVGASKDLHTGFLHRPFAGEKRIVLEADVFALLGQGTTDEIDVLALELDPPDGTTRYFVGLIVRSDGKFVLETNVSGTANRKDITGLKQTWAHATLDLDIANGRVVGTIDNARAELNLLPNVVGRGGTLKIGASWANNTEGRFQANIDNVVLDADR